METFNTSDMKMESLDNDLRAAVHSQNESQHRKTRKVFLTFFGVCMFFLFLIFKLPEARLQNLAIAHIRIITQAAGIGFSAEKVRLGFFPTPNVKFYNVDLTAFDDDSQKLKIDFLKVRPQLLSLLLSLKKVTVSAELLGGSLSGTVGGSSEDILVDLSIDDLNLEKATLLKKYSYVQFGALLNGKVDFLIGMSQVIKSYGKVRLQIQKLSIPSQMLFGFNLPTLNINESNIDLKIDAGKIAFENVSLGKDLKKDDVVLKFTGEGTLEKGGLERTKLNSRVVFDLSPRVIQSFPLLDALLGPAKGPSGQFSYKLSGPIMGLEAIPGG